MDYNITDIIINAQLCLFCNISICLRMHDFLESASRGWAEKKISLVKFEVYLSYIYLGIYVFIGHL